MKLRPLHVLLALSLCALAASARADDVTKMPPAAADKAWSVIGPWDCLQTDWHATKTLAADGSILDDKNHPDGRWNLITQDGQVHLFLRWNDWPTEDLHMVNANEFYATNGRSEMRMRRPVPTADVRGLDGSTAPAVETRSWHQGEPAVKLIRAEEGFCALTSVTGRFMGYGEKVKVYVAEDGYWYLGGDSGQEYVAAECVVVRYRGAAKPRPILFGREEAVTPVQK